MFAQTYSEGKLLGNRKTIIPLKNDTDLHWREQAILLGQNSSEIEVSGKLLTKQLTLLWY